MRKNALLENHVSFPQGHGRFDTKITYFIKIVFLLSFYLHLIINFKKIRNSKPNFFLRRYLSYVEFLLFSYFFILYCNGIRVIVCIIMYYNTRIKKKYRIKVFIGKKDAALIQSVIICQSYRDEGLNEEYLWFLRSYDRF